MDAVGILRDALSRIEPPLEQALNGLGSEALLWRPDPDANSLAWLAWHLTRGQDAQVCALSGAAQTWTEDGYADRFALPYPVDAHGYAMSSAEVAEMKSEDPELFLEYYRATASRTDAYLATLTPEDLDTIVDRHWDPPVTLGARIVSVIDDDVQHVGQMGYIRGLWDRHAG